MKEQYESVSMEIISFTSEDVIVTSVDELPFDPAD